VEAIGPQAPSSCHGRPQATNARSTMSTKTPAGTYPPSPPSAMQNVTGNSAHRSSPCGFAGSTGVGVAVGVGKGVGVDVGRGVWVTDGVDDGPPCTRSFTLATAPHPDEVIAISTMAADA